MVKVRVMVLSATFNNISDILAVPLLRVRVFNATFNNISVISWQFLY
jgi:hypothetical protein